MNRREFTSKLNNLLGKMFSEGEYPVIDFVKRSPEEQNRLFKAGLSKSDGYNIISQHQTGKAVDILFFGDEDGDGDLECVPPTLGYEYWHQIWETMGGKKMIEWDKGHFEG